VIDRFLARIDLSGALARHLPGGDARTTLPAATAVGVLVANLCVEREPLNGLAGLPRGRACRSAGFGFWVRCRDGRSGPRSGDGSRSGLATIASAATDCGLTIAFIGRPGSVRAIRSATYVIVPNAGAGKLLGSTGGSANQVDAGRSLGAGRPGRSVVLPPRGL
jgi:hypothetical protein